MADYFSREAAIDAFYVQSDDDGWWTGTAQDMEELLQGLPSADVRENVRGEWVHRKTWDRYVCNKCSFEQPLSTNFCPNCGADMRY